MSEQSFSEGVKMLRDYFHENLTRFEDMAAPGVDVPCYIDRLFTQIGKKHKLLNCSRTSLFQCLADSVILGLPIGDIHGYAFAIPRKGQACFQVGYQGKAKARPGIP